MRNRADILERSIGRLGGQRKQQRPDTGNVRVQCEVFREVPDNHGPVIRPGRNHRRVAVDGQTVDVPRVRRQCLQARPLLVPDFDGLIEAARYQQRAGAVEPAIGKKRKKNRPILDSK